MAIPDNTFEAIGIYDEADAECGIALLLLDMRERPDQIYLLDPRSGPEPLFSREDLKAMMADDGVCLFVDPVTVSGLDHAFFIHPEFQNVYTEITGKEITSDGLKLVKASLNVLVGIAPHVDLIKWRVALAGEMFDQMGHKIVRALADNPDKAARESLYKKIEHWGRCGALYAGISPLGLALYQQWMWCVGVGILKQDQIGRFFLTYEMMVEQFVPGSSYKAFYEQVEVLWQTWEKRAGEVASDLREVQPVLGGVEENESSRKKTPFILLKVKDVIENTEDVLKSLLSPSVLVRQ